MSLREVPSKPCSAKHRARRRESPGACEPPAWRARWRGQNARGPRPPRRRPRPDHVGLDIPEAYLPDGRRPLIPFTRARTSPRCHRGTGASQSALVHDHLLAPGSFAPGHHAASFGPGGVPRAHLAHDGDPSPAVGCRTPPPPRLHRRPGRPPLPRAAWLLAGAADQRRPLPQGRGGTVRRPGAMPRTCRRTVGTSFSSTTPSSVSASASPCCASCSAGAWVLWPPPCTP